MMTEQAENYRLDLGPDPMDGGAAASDELAAAPERWEQAMAEIADISIDALKQLGMREPEARRAGCAVALRLCQELGGTRYYWPRGSAMERAQRDLRIWAEHDGTVHGPRGITALARAHGMTDIHLYRIIARQRRLHLARVQGRLALSPVGSAVRTDDRYESIQR